MTREEQETVTRDTRHPAPTPGGSERKILHAKVLRARSIHKSADRLWKRLARSVRRTPREDQIEPAANALAAIRCAVEILRDTPDMDVTDRRQFTEIILREEARLEAMLNTWRRKSA